MPHLRDAITYAVQLAKDLSKSITNILNDLWGFACNALKIFSKAVQAAAVVAILGGLIYGAFLGLDKHGWIAHRHDTPVWISGDWMVGEYRDCGMLTTTPPPGVALSPKVQAELPRLFCGKDGGGWLEFLNGSQNYTAASNAFFNGGDWSEFGDEFHVLPVLYYGRINRPDKVVVEWRCQRLSGSLECKALN